MHTSHLPKVPVLMNELPCVEPFMLSLPASRRSSHTRAIRRAACACEHCVSVASLSLLFRACKRVHVLSWGVKRLPNVVNSFPIPPFPSPYPPIHPIPTRFPLVGCLWRRDVSSLPLYITKNEEREREGDVRVLLSSLILLLPLPFLGCSTPPARSNPKIDLRRIHAPPVF